MRNWALTRKVVKEGNSDGAANDGVEPDPPTDTEDGARNAGAEDCP